MLGNGEGAMKFYDALCPYNQNDKIEVRQSEPYSYCQFVMGSAHTAFGRARHPFMTGSAGWAYFASTQYILGIRPDFDGLTVDPCVPSDWKEFTAVRQWRGARYEITVKNPQGVQRGVKRIVADGCEVSKLPILPAGEVCRAEVQMVRGDNMIKFGTGGWRAVIGEEFTKANVQLLCAALCAMMKEQGVAEKGICVGYDRRFLSKPAAPVVRGGVRGYACAVHAAGP